MPSKPVVLLACAPSEVEVLRALVPRNARVVTADSMPRAAERMTQPLDAIVCSTQFDDSRMLDLVREAHALRPDVRVLCCRLAPGRLPGASLRGAAIAALALGVSAFVDLAPRVGGDAGELAAALLRLLP